jgi:acyl-CoA synthetase (AMP-forming)/AMP-acid ligase II/thioesterase domain-containing protein/acyl carrier protein
MDDVSQLDRMDLPARLRHLAVVASDTVAIRNGDVEVTFAELVARAELVAIGVVETDPGGRGPIVVLGRRSPELLIGVCGALLAGRGFTIVESDHPIARIHGLIERVDTTVVIVASPDLVPLVPEGHVAVVVDDTTYGTLGAPAVGVTPDPADIGCIVFTSGSTGTPKGVMSRHATLEVRANRRLRPEVMARGETTVPSQAPLSYAAGLARVYDMLAGRTIELFDTQANGPLAFAEWIDERGFATLSIVPSLARAILQAWPQGRRLENVTLLTTHGEGLHWADVPPLRQLVAPDAIIQVSFSSSEAGALFRMEIGPDDPIGTGAVPLGHPREDRDVRFEPVNDEPASPLEIVVYGGRIADGYWRDPELTASRFGIIEDGTRFYRTGDLAFTDDSGIHHFRGRVDDLVKIRGLLVEPAEAERVLRGVEGIRSASVLSHPGTTAPRLVGHVVVAADSAVGPAQVRRELERQLPAHLVPSVLVRHDALPLTERGKVDRAALRTDPLVPWRGAPVLPPRDLFETAVASLVSELLELPEVSRDDDLFDLGADSLMLQEVAARLSDRFGVDVSIASLVAQPRLDRLAAAVRRAARETDADSDDIIVLNPDGTRHPLVVCAGAAGTAVAFRPLADALGSDQPVWVVHQQGVLRGGRTDRSIESWATRAREVLSARGLESPYLLAGHSVGGLVAYELAQQCQRSGEPVALLALLDTSRPRQGSGHRSFLDSEPHVRTPQQWISWFVRGAGNRVLRPARRLAVRTRPPRSLEEYMVLLRSAVQLGASYRPQPLELDQPMLVVHVSRPVIVDQWAELTKVDAIEASGDHLTMLEPVHVPTIATAVQTRLDPGDAAP